MNLSVGTIDAFRKAFAQNVHDVWVRVPPPENYSYRHHIHGKVHHRMTHYNNDFQLHPLHGQLPTYRQLQGTPQSPDPCIRLEFGTQYAWIDIRNVRMRDVQKLDFGEPVILNTSKSRVAVETWINSSDTVETHDLRLTNIKNERHLRGTVEDHETNFTQKIEREVGIGIEGILDAKGKLEIGFAESFAKHFTEETEQTDTEERAENQLFKVNPHTQTSVFREQGISDAERTLSVKGILDCSFWLSSDNDWLLYFPSIETMEQWIQGGTLDSSKFTMGDGENSLYKYFSERRFENYQFDYSPLEIEVKDVVDYRDVSYSKVTRTDTPIP
ncbi:MAG: hypothetical protein OXU23_18370 [Candidatus Poribacteria bacterium]|nr:hypothetical protein [Candidatus Poribacteria bacterium]